ncbi:hypothetical protein Q4508_09060 [Amphritea sp. 2_MG-2023]|uniref:hypothetical protein n=1 Tax=Amphritea TaxID=515417 RepID=UPI001C067FE2|nr:MULTISPECIES: hypothetical protein [Amphritea]MBU2965551.1 hypothetical protein [Amphritea atlantica]MDO6418706.1 hypothetical protein [Amphritea sp. 2_MG-2023]MDX2422014.1 hypothetical protein [Amphritea sp.]
MRFPMYSSTVVVTLMSRGYTSTPLRIATYYDVTMNMNLHIMPSTPFVIHPSWRLNGSHNDTLNLEISALANYTSAQQEVTQ